MTEPSPYARVVERARELVQAVPVSERDHRERVAREASAEFLTRLLDWVAAEPVEYVREKGRVSHYWYDDSAEVSVPLPFSGPKLTEDDYMELSDAGFNRSDGRLHINSNAPPAVRAAADDMIEAHKKSIGYDEIERVALGLVEAAVAYVHDIPRLLRDVETAKVEYHSVTIPIPSTEVGPDCKDHHKAQMLARKRLLRDERFAAVQDTCRMDVDFLGPHLALKLYVER
jgi:hypothetical protein